MRTIQEKTINLANIISEDLFIKKTEGDTLYIQVEGSASISITGKNSELDTYVKVPAVNMSTFAMSENIKEAGFYMCVIGGLDQIQMTASGSGKMHWKVMGD